MKKYCYYVIPCIVLPFVVEFCWFLDHIGIVEMNFTILAAALAIVSGVIGNFSPTNKLFDYALPIVSVIGYNCYRFICGFFAKTDLETRYSIFEAIEWIFVDTSLLLCAIIAVTTFFASFKPIRILNNTGTVLCVD
jgi:hypothetical protein